MVLQCSLCQTQTQCHQTQTRGPPVFSLSNTNTMSSNTDSWSSNVLSVKQTQCHQTQTRGPPVFSLSNKHNDVKHRLVVLQCPLCQTNTMSSNTDSWSSSVLSVKQTQCHQTQTHGPPVSSLSNKHNDIKHRLVILQCPLCQTNTMSSNTDSWSSSVLSVKQTQCHQTLTRGPPVSSLSNKHNVIKHRLVVLQCPLCQTNTMSSNTDSWSSSVLSVKQTQCHQTLTRGPPVSSLSNKHNDIKHRLVILQCPLCQTNTMSSNTDSWSSSVLSVKQTQ